ncbi:MAG: NAD+ synthase [bacterium]
MLDKLPFDPVYARNVLTRFIKDEIEKFGIHNVIVGLSGGIDSSVAATLAVEALGNSNVFGYILPYKTTLRESIDDAYLMVRRLNIYSQEIDITSIVDSYLKDDDPDKLRKGNFIARVRMCILFDRSSFHNALVLGTSNKTELLLGYGTIYGDMASAINPLGDLYKTQIRSLAKELDVPERIITKPPTADLWIGQTDEGELGFTYEEADKILYHLVDEGLPAEMLIDMGYKKDTIDKIMTLIKRNQYKRTLPIVAKLSQRTVGIDFRYPRDWDK